MAVTISCQSCGYQYDGTGLQAGVQFQCTQCGNMVVVGQAPGRKAPTKGAPAARGGPAPRGPKPMGRAGGPRAAQPYGAPGAQGGPQGAAFGPPKKDNTMMIMGIIGGVIVVGMIAAIVMMTSSKENQQQQSKADDDRRAREEKEAQLKKNEQVKKDGEARIATIQAATQAGPRIAGMLASKDMTALSAMFDWTAVWEDFKNQLEKREKKPPTNPDGSPKLDKAGRPVPSDYDKFMDNPLFCDGDWEKDEKGNPTGRYKGSNIKGPDGIRQRMMGYIEMMYGGVDAQADEAAMDKQKTPAEAKFSLTLGGKVLLGRMVMIKSTAASNKYLNFYVGAAAGDTNVRILRFEDSGVLENLKQKEAAYVRKTPTNDNQFENPDRERPRDPNNPDTAGPDENPPADLAPAKKTGAACPQALINIFRDLRDGKSVTDAQIKVVQDQSRSKEDRKAFIGACVDALIDHFEKRNRMELQNLSRSLFRIYERAIGYPEKEATFDPTTFDPANDYPLRVWYDFYERYGK
ncbi:hypothetical protein EDM80_08820 [bacterium]|nr:MAG: hypothetical protein EDM80_08820 [bacterium]RIK61667.1 MAG: hypothetical protein DCC64_12670 [Planctomycetota bacterium]